MFSIYKWGLIIILHVLTIINSFIDSDTKIINCVKYCYLFILDKIGNIYSTKLITLICEKFWKCINYGNERISSIVHFILYKMFSLVLHNKIEHMAKIIENINTKTSIINNTDNTDNINNSDPLIDNNILVAIDKMINDEVLDVSNLSYGRVVEQVDILNININDILPNIANLFQINTPEKILNMTSSAVDKLKKEFDKIKRE